VTDATEALRQRVEQEATNELVCIERHYLALIIGAVILPAKADTAILAAEESAVADCDAMGVAAQIVENLLRSGEWAFGIDDPFDIAEHRQIVSEGGRLVQAGEIVEEPQLTAVKRRL
jgi:hypothetical protein